MIDPRDERAIDSVWGGRDQDAGTWRLGDDRQARLRDLLDLIGLTDAPVGGSRDRVAKVVDSCATRSHSGSPASGADLSDFPNTGSWLGALDGEVQGQDSRVERVLEAVGQPSTTAGRFAQPAERAKPRRRWVSDLLAVAAVLVAAASLAPFGQRNAVVPPTQTAAPVQIGGFGGFSGGGLDDSSGESKLFGGMTPDPDATRRLALDGWIDLGVIPAGAELQIGRSPVPGHELGAEAGLEGSSRVLIRVRPNQTPQE